MPRLYEEAAMLLLFAVGRGLVLNPMFDPRHVIAVLARTLDDLSAHDHSDAEAAAIILDLFGKQWFGQHEPGKRDRLIAVIGTFLGNDPALRRCQKHK